MAEKKSLSKGGFFYLIYNVLNLAYPFASGVYVAWVLLPESIGEVTAAQNVATYFSILAFLGIPTYGVREIAKVRDNRENCSRLFSELFIINLISTIVFSALYIAVIIIIPEYRNSIVLYLVVGLSIALNAFNISWLFEGLEEFKFISVRNIIFKIIAFVCLVVFVKDTGDYLIYAAITILGTAGNYVVNMLYYPRFVSFSIRGLSFARHMRPILYLVAVNLAIEIYSLMDITMMNFMCDKDSIAYYKYGSGIEKMLLQVVNTFTMVLVPRISYYYKEKKEEEFNTLISKGLKLIIITAVPMIIGIWFTADFLIEQIYGVQYATSAMILKLLSILLLISPIGYLLGSRILLVTDNENKMIICVSLGAATNLIGNCILIPRLSEYGATVASVISEFIVMIVYILLARGYYRLVNTFNTGLKVFFSGLVMFVYLSCCVVFVHSDWIRFVLQVIGAIIVYGVILLMSREDIITSYFGLVTKRVFTKNN